MVRISVRFGHFVFLVCLIAHVCLAAIGWNQPLLDLHDFRQTQTAITAEYVLKDGFRLDYSTPVLGRPWSIPFEFPLYQWMVAAVSRAADMPIDQAGRLVSLLCFYLALVPAFFFLRPFLDDTERVLIVLSLLLACPAYIFWSRACLIESLALLLSMSFLAAAMAAIRRRDWRFAAAACAFGTLAGLVKVTTFVVFCVPAGIALAHAFLADKNRPWGRRMLVYGGYGFLFFGPALAVTLRWTRYADFLKMRNPFAASLTSVNLEGWNFGSLGQRLSPATFAMWGRLAIGPMIGGWETLLVIPLAMLLSRQVARKGAGLCLAGFLAGPLIFTNLYFVHSYYWYACGIFLVMLTGLYLVSLLDLRANKWVLRSLVVPVPLAFFYASYAVAYLPVQRSPDQRLKVLGQAVAAATGTGGVLLTYGFDWNPAVPYYADRRALMAREEIAYRVDPATKEPVDTAAMATALANLKGDPIQAMVVQGPLKSDPAFIAEKTLEFGLSPAPIFNALKAAIYVTPAEETTAAKNRAASLLYRYCNLYDTPLSVNAGGPVDAVKIGQTEALMAPEPSEMVYDIAPNVVSVSGSFGFPRTAYAHEPNFVGADFSIEFESGGARKVLFEKYLNPATKRADRKLQSFAVPIPAGAGGKLYFRAGNSQGNYTGGFTAWTGIQLHPAGY